MDGDEEACSGCGMDDEELWDCGVCGSMVGECCAESCTACGSSLCASCGQDADETCGACEEA